jgi:hypothetical protein
VRVDAWADDDDGEAQKRLNPNGGCGVPFNQKKSAPHQRLCDANIFAYFKYKVNSNTSRIRD